MHAPKLMICVIDNGSALFLYRTLNNLKKQTDSSFSYKVLDCRSFWKSDRNTLGLDADYVLYLYSGSQLEENAVERICGVLAQKKPAWLYFDEKTYSAEINDDAYGILEKPDFDPLLFAQEVYTGEGVVFSREILKAMDLKYEGSNFAAALMEMVIAAAAQADPLHFRECLLTRHNKPELLPDERSLLSAELKEYLKKSNLDLFGIERSDSAGLHFIPLADKANSVSIIFLIDADWPDNTYFSYPEENVEIIKVAGEQPYWEKCLFGMQKARNNILCFLDARCMMPSRSDFETLIRYVSLPYVGFVSPCVYGQDEILYAGAFSTAGCPAHFSKAEDMLQHIEKDLHKIRQTSIPAWQFWMIQKDVFIQTASLLEQTAGSKSFAKEQLMQELAFHVSSLGKKNLYIGSVQARCEKADTDQKISGFCDMLLRHKDAYFLDPHCPAGLRSGMRKTMLKGIRAYFPECWETTPANGKKILVLTHELSLTGAPMVLSHGVRILKEHFQVVVASPVDGVLKDMFLSENVPVLILGDMSQNEEWLRWVEDFDLVLVNTVVPFRQIEQLGNCRVPVMWWLHDAKSGYEDYLQYVLPETLPENVRVFSVSKYADDAVKTYRPKYKTQLLLYGLRDEGKDWKDSVYSVDGADGKKLFVCVGTVIRRKGQDILAEAIRLLPERIRKQCLFLFIGKCIDEDIFRHVRQIAQEYPDEVRQIDAVAHDQICNLYKQATAVICSSRDDPLPTFMAETMMVSGVCICSENTGMVSIIRHGENGFLYKNDDAKKLAQCIQLVAEQDGLDTLREEARKTFEQYFTMDIFEKNLLKCVMDCMDHRAGGEHI